MFLTLLLILLTAFLAVVLYQKAYERPPNFPPGPVRLPVWGSYWLLALKDRFRHRGLWATAQRWGAPLIGFHLGPAPAVAAHGPRAVRELLTRPEFTGRPDSVVFRGRAFDKRLGIFFIDGPFWAHHRRFVLRHLRDFGFGRRMGCSDEALRLEAEEMVALLRGDWVDESVCRDGCVLLPAALHLPFVSLLWTMFAGRRLGRGDQARALELGKAAAGFVRSMDPLGGAVTFTPWLRHLLPRASGYKGAADTGNLINRLVEEEVIAHEKDFCEGQPARDFLDHYLAAMSEEIKMSCCDDERLFLREQLQVMGSDMLLATATTITGNMSYALAWLARRPDIQRKAQEEVDASIGRSRTPSLDDRASCPYVEAILRETLRRHTILPLATPHLATEDTSFDGYDIPKNTIMFANLHSVHMDKETWGDPEKFRPERFLDEQGQIVKKDLSMPFGAGKRLCPGETFARQGMFVVLAALLQNFWFEPEGTLPSPDVSLPGLTLTPPNMWLRVSARA